MGAAVHVVAAYDPHYHYVAFNKISDVLSDEAGKVFRFKEQEQLHEELIDDGIAKIYQAHLNVAKSVAEAEDVEITCELIAGKPHQAIRKYAERHNASLLMVGKIGVHADPDLDIGGTTENLLRSSPCHLWVGLATHVPPLDVVAAETIMWSEEAEEKIGRAPDFVRGIARTAVIRQAQAAGHTFITTRFVDDVMRQMMPGQRSADGDDTTIMDGFEPLAWTPEASAILARIDDPSTVENIRLRSEKAARRDADTEVRAEHVQQFTAEPPPPAASHDGDTRRVLWSAASLARLNRIPEAYREKAREEIEAHARTVGATEIAGEVEDAGFAVARRLMCPEPNATERLEASQDTSPADRARD